MRIGVFGGGFKPFTTGHFSKLATALQENDKVILFYGIAARTKGSEYQYTKEMANSIFNVVEAAAKREYGDKLVIQKSTTTPMLNTFSLIGAIKDGKPLAQWGIDSQAIEQVTVYADPGSIQTYTTNVVGKTMKTGEDKEQRYYGDMYQTGKLVFDTALSDDGSSDRMVAAMQACGYSSDDDITDKIEVRGSHVRSLAQACDWEAVKSYLPNFLNKDELQQIVGIMASGVKSTPVVENLLRNYIQEVMH